MRLPLAYVCVALLSCTMVWGDDIPFREKLPVPGVKGVTSVNIGDLNRDGLPDIAVFEGGTHNDGVRHFAWYEAPEWTRHDFHQEKPGIFIGDTEMADLDGDGWLDVVVPRDDHSTGAGDLSWYENPRGDGTGDWIRHTIYADFDDTYHQGDIEIADMDNDGRPDVVCRHLGKRQVRVCMQNGDGTWTVRSFDVRDREGMKLADVDRDGVTDIVLNGFWWAGAEGGWRDGEHEEFTIDGAFFSAKTQRLNNSTKNAIADFNGDGRVDVGLVSAEGNKVYLGVYLAPEDPRKEEWRKIVVKKDFGNCHQLEVADVDLDGAPDLIGGCSFGDDHVFVWYNRDKAARWEEQIVDREAGLYSGVVGDLGGDGDADIVGPNSYSKGETLWIFENSLRSGPAP